jgi:hypothetical protein
VGGVSVVGKRREKERFEACGFFEPIDGELGWPD